jgi:SAM-dependent methyltransferase
VVNPEQVDADMLAFWNGQGGHTWVTRQEHTDATLAPVTEALLAFAAPRAGERVLDVGCGCGGPTLEFARAVGPAGRVAALDISGPMLAEGEARAKSAGITNIDWRQADPAMAALDEYDLLTSALARCSSATRWPPLPKCVTPRIVVREWRSCAGGRLLKTRGWRCR